MRSLANHRQLIPMLSEPHRRSSAYMISAYSRCRSVWTPIPFVFTACVALRLNPSSPVCTCAGIVGSKYRKRNWKMCHFNDRVREQQRTRPSLFWAKSKNMKVCAYLNGFVRKPRYCIYRQGTYGIKIQSVSTGWRCSRKRDSSWVTVWHGWGKEPPPLCHTDGESVITGAQVGESTLPWQYKWIQTIKQMPANIYRGRLRVSSFRKDTV